jgi:hypothetical protein
MAIFGFTVSETGESLQRLAVTTQVAIGEVKDSGRRKTRPKKLGHFVFLRKYAELEWDEDPKKINAVVRNQKKLTSIPVCDFGARKSFTVGRPSRSRSAIEVGFGLVVSTRKEWRRLSPSFRNNYPKGEYRDG